MRYSKECMERMMCEMKKRKEYNERFLKNFEEFRRINLREAIQSTTKFYHGGQLNLTSDNRLSPEDIGKVPASKRQEYGPGLYLTTSSKVVEKYAKGSRKLYLVTVDRGKDISDVKIPVADIDKLVDSMSKAKVKKIKERIEGSRFEENGKVGAYIILNFCINDRLLQNEKGRKGIRDFLVSHGADYELHNSPFGWKETMMVLFNLNKISNIKQLDRKEAVEDLH